MKRLAILGSTGSIGCSTLDVVSNNKAEFKVHALVAGRNIDLLAHQIKSFNPEIVAVPDKDTADSLSKKVNGVEIFSGIEGINYAASHENSDYVISAIVGSAGLAPTLTAVKSGKTIGLANKEALVMAGELIMREAEKNNARIIPIDSEHSAVFQCIEGHKKSDIDRIILTASGGPFVNKSRAELNTITAEEALRHPNWSMGRKITIDSATLMNKGFEVIEACWLFGIPPEKIDVLIHPQSIVHSIVEFKDRSCLAQMSLPDMRGPISYALSYPERIQSPIKRLELDKIASLTFQKPDYENFPCLSYAYDAIRTGGTMPCVLSASNEIAVHAFLNHRIKFNDISVVIKEILESHDVKMNPDIDTVHEAERWARQTTEQHIKELKT